LSFQNYDVTLLTCVACRNVQLNETYGLQQSNAWYRSSFKQQDTIRPWTFFLSL